MPYVQQTITAGKTIEIARYYTSRYNKKGIKRSDKVKPTTEQQEKVNQRKAEKTLRLELNANFVDGDLHIDMGYIRKHGEPYRTKEQMREDANKFLRAMRKVYKAEGKVLKYIHVMEIGKKGSRHHHLVVNYIDVKKIQACWKKVYPRGSRVHYTPLNTDGDYSALAAYLIKYTSETIGTEKTLQGKRWNSSKNLTKPKIDYEIIKDRNQFYTEPKPIKGYYIVKDSIEVGVHSPEFYGYGYLSYRMVRLE